jgi:hypothetical protein
MGYQNTVSTTTSPELAEVVEEAAEVVEVVEEVAAVEAQVDSAREVQTCTPH